MWGHSQQGQVQQQDEEEECQWDGGRELLVAFVRAGFLESWRQMTDGSVSSASREWEVRRGGGKPRHHGKEQERKSSGGRKAESREFYF